MVKTIVQVYGNLPKPHKIILGTLTLVTVVVGIWKPVVIHPDDMNINTLKKELSIKKGIMLDNFHNNSIDISQSANLNNNIIIDNDNNESLSDEGILNDNRAVTDEHIVSNGDNLTSILTQYNLDVSDIAILSNQYKVLRNLKIGQTLNWELNKNGELQILTWIVSEREMRVYTRQGNSNIFHEEKKIRTGVWIEKVIKGTIINNLINSVMHAGLTYKEACEVSKVLKLQIDLRKLKYGDKFSILLSREMFLDIHSKQSRLLGIHLLSNGKNYYVFRADNGHYYDSEANGLELDFLRYPTGKPFRVSSHFSLRRVNPVTGRLAPHQGVDFSMPIGTPILAVSDGDIIAAKYSGAAGNFIAIRHGRQYTTRYMHLRKLLVKPGQKIKKGECIGLSGNTGRTTGPHLHYELWFNKRAVNPLTVNLPDSGKLTGKERQLYLEKVKDNTLKLKID
ncbi:murein DD-endopeptidase MepM [Arsenophonus symbiont of Ornithomya chloropus]|uniref:murein DD-endopeptidase MepM n=1 Tax=Arsenophonus symbiont of Ornithomya chloropus TaxID=634121 RepID=UPI0032B1F477